MASVAVFQPEFFDLDLRATGANPAENRTPRTVTVGSLRTLALAALAARTPVPSRK